MQNGLDQWSWNPALYAGERTLAEVYREMPRDPASRVPFVVRLLENPRSVLALPGAVDLFGHDCIHVALGRGLLPQDEAFVLGFTMGTAHELRPWHVRLFELCARGLYPAQFRFRADDVEVFELGVAAARSSGATDLARVDYRSLLRCSLRELRAKLGVDAAYLKRVYRVERARFPHTAASARLAG